MKKEKRPLKEIIKTGIISGLVFACVMAIFDYFSKEPFSFLKFVIHFIIFGAVMSAFFKYKYTKKDK